MKTVYTPSRALEWYCAWSAMGVGLVLLAPGSTFSTSPSFAQFGEVMDEVSWGVLVVTVALVRFAALIVNGHYHRTPIARALTAALGAALWAYIASLFFFPGQPLSTGIAIYTALAGADCFSAWRSGRDAMIAWLIWKEGRRA